jgi:hypothetical protein
MKYVTEIHPPGDSFRETKFPFIEWKELKKEQRHFSEVENVLILFFCVLHVSLSTKNRISSAFCHSPYPYSLRMG